MHQKRDVTLDGNIARDNPSLTGRAPCYCLNYLHDQEQPGPSNGAELMMKNLFPLQEVGRRSLIKADIICADRSLLVRRPSGPDRRLGKVAKLPQYTTWDVSQRNNKVSETGALIQRSSRPMWLARRVRIHARRPVR